MPRSIWSGAISFGLVNVPVKLYSAVSRKTVRFHQLNSDTGHRISQKRVDSVTDEEVPYEKIVKGFELTKRPIERAVTDAWAAPSRDPAIRRDLRAVLRGVDARHLLDAVPRLREFDKPVTLAWAREDRLVFPPSIAERLAADFPRARIEWIDDSLTFVPEDRPDALAAILRAAAAGSSQ